MTRRDQVAAVVRTDVLVLRQGQQDDLRAALLGALAEEGGPLVLVELARPRRNLVVGAAKRVLVLADPLFAAPHSPAM